MFSPHLHPLLLTSRLPSFHFPFLFPIYLHPTIFVSSPLSHIAGRLPGMSPLLPPTPPPPPHSFSFPWSVPWRISLTLPYPHLPIRDTVVVNQQLRRREQERRRVIGKRGGGGGGGGGGVASAPQTAPPWKTQASSQT